METTDCFSLDLRLVRSMSSQSTRLLWFAQALGNFPGAETGMTLRNRKAWLNVSSLATFMRKSTRAITFLQACKAVFSQFVLQINGIQADDHQSDRNRTHSKHQKLKAQSLLLST